MNNHLSDEQYACMFVKTRVQALQAAGSAASALACEGACCLLYRHAHVDVPASLGFCLCSPTPPNPIPPQPISSHSHTPLLLAGCVFAADDADGLSLAAAEAGGYFRVGQYGQVYTLDTRINELLLEVVA